MLRSVLLIILINVFYLNGLAYGSAVQLHSFKSLGFVAGGRWAHGTSFIQKKKICEKKRFVISPFLSLSFIFESHLSFNCLLFSYTMTCIFLLVSLNKIVCGGRNKGRGKYLTEKRKDRQTEKFCGNKFFGFQLCSLAALAISKELVFTLFRRVGFAGMEEKNVFFGGGFKKNVFFYVLLN